MKFHQHLFFLIVFLISFLFTHQIFAQNKQIVDSLNLLIRNSKADTVRINLLNELAGHYLFTDMSQAKKPIRDALKLGEKSGYNKGMIDSYNRMGILYFRQGFYDSSLVWYQNGLKIAEDSQDTLSIFKFKGNIALSYSWMGKFEKSLEIYFEVIRLKEKNKLNGLESNFLDVANIYYQLKDYKSAREYAFKAQKLAEKNNDDRTLANAYNTLGVICNDSGKSKEAVAYYKEAQKLKNKTGDILGQINTMINISMIYQENNEYNKAMEILDTIVELSLQSGSQQSLATAYSNQGVVYTCLNQFEKANSSFIKSYNIFSNIGALKYMVELAEKIGLNYERMHDYKNASLFFNNLAGLKDSLFRLEMTKNLAEMKTSYETEKKEAENIRLTRENEIQLLKLQTEKKVKQNTVIIIISGSALIILLLLLLFVRFRLRKKAEMEKKEADQQKLRFKAVIEAEEKERIRIAKDLHDGLGQLLSTARINIAGLEGEVKKEEEVLVNNSLKMIDEAVKEVRSISHNMMPATLIEFGLIKATQNLIERINEAGLMKVILITDEITEKFEQSTEIALYRIVQEVLNNMIKHSNAKNIIIELRKTNSRILLKIKDDGKGFDIKEIDRSQGIGWKNIFSRLSMINGNINIQSLPGAGTVINIDFSI